VAIGKRGPRDCIVIVSLSAAAVCAGARREVQR
jgi:hypothetical protein